MSDDVGAESMLERELAPLLSIRGAFPKALIARTRHEPYTREGALVLGLASWLAAVSASSLSAIRSA